MKGKHLLPFGVKSLSSSFRASSRSPPCQPFNVLICIKGLLEGGQKAKWNDEQPQTQASVKSSTYDLIKCYIKASHLHTAELFLRRMQIKTIRVFTSDLQDYAYTCQLFTHNIAHNDRMNEVSTVKLASIVLAIC